MSKNNGVLTEHEALEMIKDLLKLYEKTYQKEMKGQYDALLKIKEGFPTKFVDQKDEDYETHMLEAANAKHESIVSARRFTGIASEVALEIEYFESLFKIELADSALSLKFEKITEGLRDAYVKTKKELKDLKSFHQKMSNYAKSADRLVRAFESDEINFRRLADKHNKMHGIH